jgi:hypothetical protein
LHRQHTGLRQYRRNRFRIQAVRPKRAAKDVSQAVAIGIGARPPRKKLGVRRQSASDYY